MNLYNVEIRSYLYDVDIYIMYNSFNRATILTELPKQIFLCINYCPILSFATISVKRS